MLEQFRCLLSQQDATSVSRNPSFIASVSKLCAETYPINKVYEAFLKIFTTVLEYKAFPINSETSVQF